MTKPNPYCECDKWDQPAGICAYCHGYTDGWVEEAALVAERDALRAKVKEQEDVARIFRELADEQVDRAVAERDALRAALAERGESDFCRQAVAERVLLKGALEKVVGFLGTEWLPWKARAAALDALDALAGKGVG